MAKLRIVSDKAGVSMTATLNDCETTKELLKALQERAPKAGLRRIKFMLG